MHIVHVNKTLCKKDTPHN